MMYMAYYNKYSEEDSPIPRNGNRIVLYQGTSFGMDQQEISFLLSIENWVLGGFPFKFDW